MLLSVPFVIFVLALNIVGDPACGSLNTLNRFFYILGYIAFIGIALAFAAVFSG